jgi:hypothetical protein
LEKENQIGYSDFTESMLAAFEILADAKNKQNVQTITIEASISSVDDMAKGEYTIEYLGNKMKAFSASTTIYNVGQKVYVIIPNGDYTKNKIILSPIEGVSKDTSTQKEQEYIDGTVNLLTGEVNQVQLCSYRLSKYEIPISSADNLIFLGASIKKYKTIRLSCKIKTSLSYEQKRKMGDYYILFRCRIKDGTYYEVKIDTSNILGDPYSQTQWSHQSAVVILPEKAELDTTFIPVVECGCLGFIESSEEKPNDIFFKDIELKGVKTIPVAKGYSLEIAADKGTIFNPSIVDEIRISPSFKLDGEYVVDLQSKGECYWFVKDSTVNAEAEGFMSRMGVGWYCLNSMDKDKNYLSDKDFKLTVKSNDVLDTVIYGCLINYNSNLYRAEIELKQIKPLLKFTVTPNAESYSPNGVDIHIDAIAEYKLSAGEKLSFHWSRYDKYGNFIDNEFWQITGKDSNRESIVMKSDKVDEKNTVYCMLKSNQRKHPMAYGQCDIITEIQKGIKLVIYNKDALYKYDANNISPFNPSYANGIVKTLTSIKPIELKMFKEDGTEFGELEYDDCEIQWKVPVNSLFEIEDKEDDNVVLDENEEYYLINSKTLPYKIKNRFDAIQANNNIITCSVKYDGKTYEENFSILFLKDGDIGTNGTAYVGLITYRGRPQSNDGHNLVIRGIKSENKIYVLDENRNRINLEANPIKFGTNVYYEGELVSSDKYSVKWELMFYSKKYDENTREEINNTDNFFDINSKTGQLYINLPVGSMNVEFSKPPIIRATININNSILYAYYIIDYCIVTTKTDSSQNYLELKGGDFEIMFSPDGSVVEKKTSDYFQMYFDDKIVENALWTPASASDFFTVMSSEDDITKKYLEINQALKDKYFNYIKIYNGSWYYYRPILLRRNPYGLADLNGWDGTKLEIDKDGNYIYAPQVGAGRKDDDNTFTGVIMGTVKKNGSSSGQEGIIGLTKGQQSFFLNCKDGSATFGLDSGGQIIIKTEGNKKEAVIRSGNYQKYEEGKPGAGMEIDMQNSSIKFGSGNFSVDSDGNIIGRKGLIGGWNITQNSISTNYVFRGGAGDAYQIVLRNDADAPDNEDDEIIAGYRGKPNNMTKFWWIDIEGNFHAPYGTADFGYFKASGGAADFEGGLNCKNGLKILNRAMSLEIYGLKPYIDFHHGYEGGSIEEYQNQIDSKYHDRTLRLIENNQGILTLEGTLEQTSDRRLKENIQPLNHQYLKALKNFVPSSYNFIKSEGRNTLGLIAQDVKKALEDAGIVDMPIISQNKDGIYSLDYSQITTLNTLGYLDQEKRISQIEQAIEELKNIIKEIKGE